MSWPYGKNTRRPLSLVTIKKNLSLFCSMPRRVLKLLSFLEKSTKTFLQFDLQKKNSSNLLKIYHNIHRKNLSAIIERLLISLKENQIYQLSVSLRASLKLLIIVIALVYTERFIVPISTGISWWNRRVCAAEDLRQQYHDFRRYAKTLFMLKKIPPSWDKCF